MNGARRNCMAAGGAAKERLCRATGGRVDAGAAGSDDMAIGGAPGKARGGKSAKPAGKGTTVNVLINPGGAGSASTPAPPAAAAAGLPPSPPPRPMMPPPGAGPAGAPPPGMMPRARGGRVCKAVGGGVSKFNYFEPMSADGMSDVRDAIRTQREKNEQRDPTRNSGYKGPTKTNEVLEKLRAGRAAGGRVNKAHLDEAQDRKLIKTMIAQAEAKPHREGRAKGGRVKQTAGMESATGRAERPGWR